LNGRNAIGGAW